MVKIDRLQDDDKYKLIETSSMSGPFLGPLSFSQERIHGVTANPLSKHELLILYGPAWTYRILVWRDGSRARVHSMSPNY